MTTICAKPKQTKQFVVAPNALTYNPCPAPPTGESPQLLANNYAEEQRMGRKLCVQVVRKVRAMLKL